MTNPSSRPVVSLTPFLTSSTCLHALRKNGEEFKWNGKQVCQSDPIDSSTTTTFAPGETKQAVLNSYDTLLGIGPSVLVTRSAPRLPGTYALSFVYGAYASAQAEYTVVPADLEADAIARVHDFVFPDFPDKPPQPHPTYVHVLAIRADGQSYICVQQSKTTNTSRVARKELLKTGLDVTRASMVFATPFKRVASSSAPIASLAVTADRDENLTIEWTNSDGVTDHLYYSASYPAFNVPQQDYQ